MKHIITLILFLISTTSFAQVDNSLLKQQQTDSIKEQLNMDAVYNRPFLSFGKLPVSVGGYAEVNWQHIGSDGVSDGLLFQLRRMTLFVASSF